MCRILSFQSLTPREPNIHHLPIYYLLYSTIEAITAEKMLSFNFGPTAALLLLIFLSYKVINLYRWIQAAKTTGLPYTVVPLLETEALAKFLTPILRKVYHNYLLEGKGWPHWCRFMIRDWAWEDKRRAHDEYGEVFLVVSPEGIICYSSDAIMSWDVMNRRNEFTKPRDKYSKCLNISSCPES